MVREPTIMDDNKASALATESYKGMEEGTVTATPFFLTPDENEEDGWACLANYSYNPSIRFLMGLAGLPAAWLGFMLLVISPMMLAFMHDSPDSMKYPGNVKAMFAFVVYLAIDAVIIIYAYVLLTSAWRGRTVVSRCPLCCRTRRALWSSASPWCAALLLAPAFAVLVAYLIQKSGFSF